MPCGTGAARKRGEHGFETARVFLRDCRKGTDQQGGGSLHISQPPLSMRLKELEEELDVQLIYREGKAWQDDAGRGGPVSAGAVYPFLCCGSGKGYSGKPEQGLRPGADRGVPAVPLAGKYTHSRALNREFPICASGSGSWTTSPSNGTCRSGILTSRWSSFQCRTPTTPCSRWRGRNSLRCMGRGFPRPRHDPSALRN